MAGLFVSLFAAAAVQAAAAPAPVPDFSGLWTLDPARSDMLRDNRAIDRQIRISQDGANFRVGPAPAPGAVRVSSEVDGPTPRDAAGHRAYWEGPAMVTEQQLEVSGTAVTIRQERTLSAPAEMLVETQVMFHHGYNPGEPLPSGVARDTYVRSAR